MQSIYRLWEHYSYKDEYDILVMDTIEHGIYGTETDALSAMETMRDIEHLCQEEADHYVHSPVKFTIEHLEFINGQYVHIFNADFPC